MTASDHRRHDLDDTRHEDGTSRADAPASTGILRVRRWPDPLVERVGWDACGDYVEIFWLPIIGPTSTLLLRRMAVTAVLRPDGFTLDGRTMSRSLGLGTDISPRGSLARSVHRLTIFGLARWHESHLAVRTVVPPLTMKHLARLPEHLQRAHALWAESDPSVAYDTVYAPAPNCPERLDTDGNEEPASAWAAAHVDVSVSAS